MSRKSLLYLVLFLLLSAGNIYFVCRYFILPQAEFQVEGNENDFLCRWYSNAASVTVENDNIVGVGAASDASDFYWTVTDSYFMLNYNKAMVVDYNKDFVADYVLTADGERYIQVNGELVRISEFHFKTRTATLPDGKIVYWKNNRWQ